jgi:hypothetical protein
MKQRKHRHRGPYDPQTLTRAVTHIRLEAANAGKLTALDALAQVYLPLCQQYVTLFCTQERPNKVRAPLFATPLSERGPRVAIQQAAGIAQSWRTNRAQAYQDYADDLLDYHEQQTEGTLDAKAQEPAWKEWNVPALRQTCIQANANVVELEPSEDSTFDYWLTISTLAFRKQLLIPVKLAAYHREALKDKAINSSVTLNKRGDGWWLTLSNAYLYASNLAHIPKQIAWNAAKRGVAAIRVRSAYSSQECSVCYYTHRKNRPNQQTFCCRVCGFSTHADLNAAINIERRLGDAELQACKDKAAIKALLMQRHREWKQQNGWP